MNKHWLTLLVLAGCAITAQAATQIPAPPQSGPVAIVGGTVHTITGDVIPSGTVVFTDGKIVAVGAGVAVPQGATVVDASGKHVYPGMINAYTGVGLTEVGSVRGTVDRAETGSINPNARAEVSVNPESEIIPVTRANGVALALTAPAGGTLSGRSALLRMDGWTWEDMTFKAPCAMQVVWPDMSISHSRRERRSEEEQVAARLKAIESLDEAFNSARSYSLSKDGAHDIRWEAMRPTLTGELPVMISANTIQEIESAVGWASAKGLKVILLGGEDAGLVTDLLKQKNVPVILTGTLKLPERTGDAYDEPFAVAAKLYAAGVKFCISSEGSGRGGGEAAQARNLPYEAAMAAAYGLPREEALKAVTLYPAQILGVADRVGSIEAGKDATLIVTDGDPLEITSHVEQMYIEGRKIDLSSRQTQLYEKYLKKYSKK